MPILPIEKIKQAFIKLGEFLSDPDAQFSDVMEGASRYNPWFTSEMVEKAVKGIAEMLVPADVEAWTKDIIPTAPKTIGLILAGNIPLVGLHDILAVLATGNIAQLKLSSSDDKLIPAVLDQLITLEPAFTSHIQYTERLKDFDAVIATGSNNSSRYFEYYFSKVPYIIRKNRNSVAVLTGNETPAAIVALGNDIFDYFGLGCRNVSKVFIPEGYDLEHFFGPLQAFQPVINHFKYNNNYDYNKSIYLVNKVPHFDNGFLLLKEDEGFTSPLSVVFFEKYSTPGEVAAKLENHAEAIQCVVSEVHLNKVATVAFGRSQHPKLWDYADNVNTIDFLTKLN